MKICAQRPLDIGAITEAAAFSQRWNVPQAQTLPFKRRGLHILKLRILESGHTMNIFYIIGVVVVVIIVASILGLHV